MPTFEVSLRNTFDAEDPHDALAQMVAWASEYAYFAGYRVTDVDTGDSVFLDAELLTLRTGEHFE